MAVFRLHWWMVFEVVCTNQKKDFVGNIRHKKHGGV